MKIKIEQRPLPKYDECDWPETIPPIIRQILVARGSVKPESVENSLSKLLHWSELSNIVTAAKIISKAIRENQWITISGDYDCDGATGTSVAYRGLKLLGAQNVKYIVPNRFKHGYGLSPALVDDMDERTNLIITVDSGVSNVEGVARAKELGRTVVITDHHLPGDVLPEADAIVNPNLKDDNFASKATAGVGVMFYVLLATRHLMRIEENPSMGEPDLSSLLDLVALGTIADLVPLDQNNRILVSAGLRRMRRGKVSLGVKGLVEKAGKNLAELTSTDIAFGVAPRLNAAGRMEDMSVGIQALISDDPRQVAHLIDLLEEINDSRKEKQQEMIGDAEQLLAHLSVNETRLSQGVVLFDEKWHSGIVGLVASKIKETLHRPVVALAPAEPGSNELRGSARSIPGFHLRDALALIDTRYPGLMKKFGGHAMAAGLSLDKSNVDGFAKAFDDIARETISKEHLDAVLHTDGPLPVGCLTTRFIDLLNSFGPWGQGYPQPIFDNVFNVVEWRIIKEKHLKVKLEDPRDHSWIDGICFNTGNLTELPTSLRVVFELDLNVWNDRRDPQLLIRHIQPDVMT